MAEESVNNKRECGCNKNITRRKYSKKPNSIKKIKVQVIKKFKLFL